MHTRFRTLVPLQVTPLGKETTMVIEPEQGSEEVLLLLNWNWSWT
jgi:hypothetical protein